MKLNVGCGTTKYPGYINIDTEAKLEPDLVANVINGLPYEDNSADEIIFYHTIEHIPDVHHESILREFHRILEPGGRLVVAYPEFTRCAINFMENKRGMRLFWKATLYGRQLYPSDFHVALMDTKEFTAMLEGCGFVEIKSMPEKDQEHNTIISCRKGPRPETREEVVTREIFAT